MTKERFNSLSGQVLNACVTVHKELGPGLLESIYDLCLQNEMRHNGIAIESQVSIPLTYRGEVLPKDFRIDILVEGEIIVEVKAVERILPVHQAQLISYLKLANKRLGLLVNFNVAVMKDGFQRFVNKFPD